MLKCGKQNTVAYAICIFIAFFRTHNVKRAKTKKSQFSGGASGIGKAISQTLAKHGARVVVADLDSGNAAATAKALPASQSHSSFACDVSNADSVKGLSEHVKSLGTPSILVNCAGITKVRFFYKFILNRTPTVILCY